MLRIATDHPEAVEDARTESVAAPVARAAGLLVPQMLVFDDSRTLVDRPYSIWERIPGETLGLLTLDSHRFRDVWCVVGQQLAWLHDRVRECSDPHGWLDRPGRAFDLHARVAELTSISAIDSKTARELDAWIERLTPFATPASRQCFLHNDVHEMNIMCTREGSLSAVIDWGDAGWGDAALEFAQVPLGALPIVLAGYARESTAGLGGLPEARIIWDKLERALEPDSDHLHELSELRRFVRDAGTRWRQVS